MDAEEIAKILDDLGSRLGPTGQHVLELSVQRVVTTSLIWCVVCAGLLVIDGVVYAYVAKYMRKRYHAEIEEGGYRAGEDWMFGFWMSTAIATIVAVLLGLLAITNLTSLLNAEYEGIRSILYAIRG